MRIYFILLILSFIQSHSQNDWYSYSFPDTVPKQYKVNILGDIEKVKLECAGKFNQGALRDYAEDVSYTKFYQVNFGTSYYNLDLVEEYVNQVFKKIVPSEFQDKNFKVYIRRDISVNAAAMEGGIFFINIGTIAAMEDEAQLAMILGHELAHYLNNDFIEQEKIDNKGESFFARTFFSENSLKLSREFSRSQEYSADSLGIILCNTVGYDPRAELEVTNLFKRIESQLIDYEKNPQLEVFSTHPKAENRYAREEEVIGTLSQKGNQSFLVSTEEQFWGIKQVAVQESMNLMLRHNFLAELQKNALKMYLIDPENPNYSYLFLEALRRDLEIYPDKIDSMLSLPYVKTRKKGILYNVSKLFDNPSDFSLIREKEINKNSPITYRDFIKYFSSKVLSLQSTEGYLTVALIYWQIFADEKLMEVYLTKYLSLSNSKYKIFAQKLLNDHNLEFHGQHLFVMNSIKGVQYNLKNVVSVNSDYLRQAQFYKDALVNKIQKKNPKENTSVLFVDMDSYQKPLIINFVYDIIKSYTKFMITTGVTDPECWEFMKKQNISKITFTAINTTYYKGREFSRPFIVANSLYYGVYDIPPVHKFEIGYARYDLESGKAKFFTNRADHVKKLTPKRCAKECRRLIFDEYY